MQEAAEKEILISVIIATFNVENQLTDCLSSILKYADKNTEIVVVDGGSNDGTISILKAFNYPLFTWITEPDKGIYDALNKGIKLAKGRWLHFLGADDRLLPGFEELSKNVKESHTVYYGNSVPHYDGINKPSYGLLHGKFDNYRMAKYSINHQAILYPSSVFKKYQYNLKYKVYADYGLNIQLWGDQNFSKVYFQINIVQYNMTGFSSATKDQQFIHDKPQIIKDAMGFFIYAKYMLKRFKNKRKGKMDML